MNDTEIIDLERNKLKTLIEGLKEAVILLDTDQNIIGANHVATEMFGHTYADIIDRPITNFLHIASSTGTDIDVDTYCPKGGLDTAGVFFREDNASLRDPDGTVRIVNFESRKIANGSKIDLGAILILTNVFQQSELERMKVDFVSMAVHVLRTPLTVTRGFLKTLMHEATLSKLTDDEAEDLKNASIGAEELNMLVENLLHLSEIQKGTFSMKPTKVNYPALVTSVVSELKPTAEAKGLKLFFAPPQTELPMVTVDFVRIKEVLTNLIENAIKFTEAGGVEINIVREDGVLHTFVKDTGKGIPEANLHYIFTKFYRIKDPLSMDASQGLGLYISKKIIDAHNGDIWAESIEGQGSIFHFTIPVL